MPSTGAGTSADHADGPAAAVGDPTDATEPLEGTPADEEDDEELVFGADDKESIADEDEWLPSRSPAPAAAAKRRGGKGRGHGRGRGRARGAAAAPSAAPAAPAPSAAPAAAPAEKVQKYKWKDVAQHKFTPRVQYAGEELPVLSELFDGLTSKSSPYEFFEKLDAPDSEYLKRAVNSENYRDWRVAHKMDGMGKDGMAKRSYRDAAQIEYADMRLLDAAILLNGLDPAVSRHHQFSKERLAIIGHRVAHLFNEDRYKMVRKPQNGLPSFWGALYAHPACGVYLYGRPRAACTCVHADYPPRTCLGDA